MAAVKELLKAEADGTLSFGDYTLGSKTKLDGFEFQGDLYKVKTFSESQSISRELMLIKVKYNKGNRREILETCDVMKANIIDLSKSTMMIQICDEPEKVKLFISMLASVSIVEMARTGTLALQKCMESDA